MAEHAAAPHGAAPATPAWLVVLEQELRELWSGGRGIALSFAFSVLLSLIAYLLATNTALNFLEHRESVDLLVEVAIAVGAMLSLLAAADAVSGERERATLETLLLSPAPRRQLVAGKLLAALSLWLAAFLITVPYAWFLARGVGVAGEALAAGLAVGTLLAVFLACFGLVVSLFAASNRFSLSLTLFVLLALFAPTQLPSSAQEGWAGQLLLRANPMTAGEHYVNTIIVGAHAWSRQADWLASPIAAALALAVAVVVLGERALVLRPGGAR